MCVSVCICHKFSLTITIVIIYLLFIFLFIIIIIIIINVLSEFVLLKGSLVTFHSLHLDLVMEVSLTC